MPPTERHWTSASSSTRGDRACGRERSGEHQGANRQVVPDSRTPIDTRSEAGWLSFGRMGRQSIRRRGHARGLWRGRSRSIRRHCHPEAHGGGSGRTPAPGARGSGNSNGGTRHGGAMPPAIRPFGHLPARRTPHDPRPVRSDGLPDSNLAFRRPGVRSTLRVPRGTVATG